jgi:hypothetical protein
VKKSPKKGDGAQKAWAVVQQATNEVEAPPVDPRVLKGASKGGKARASKLTATQRSEIAKKAANARWKAN